VNAIKQEIKSLCIRGAAVLAVDNACKFLLGSDEMIPEVVNFGLKTAVMQLLKDVFGGDPDVHRGMSRDGSFYYSVSLRF
jgi:hypothetical protein